MALRIQQLPNDIFENNAADLLLHDYYINKACLKNKIMLTKNVFSFLVEGSKELITHNQAISIENDKFLLIKSGNCLMSENLSPSNNYRSILMFFSDEKVIRFCEKYQINVINNPNNNPYHICNYDTFISHFYTSLQRKIWHNTQAISATTMNF